MDEDLVLFLASLDDDEFESLVKQAGIKVRAKKFVEKTIEAARKLKRAIKKEPVKKKRSWVPYVGSTAAGIPLGLGYGYLVGRATKQSSNDLDELIDELIKEAALLEAVKVVGRTLKGARQHARAVGEAWRAGRWKEVKDVLGVKKEMLTRKLREAWQKGRRPAKEVKEEASWAKKYLLPGAAGAALATPIGFGLGRRKEGSDDGTAKLAIAMHLADVSGKDIPLEKIPPEIFGRLLAQYISKGGE